MVLSVKCLPKRKAGEMTLPVVNLKMNCLVVCEDQNLDILSNTSVFLLAETGTLVPSCNMI